MAKDTTIATTSSLDRIVLRESIAAAFEAITRARAEVEKDAPLEIKPEAPAIFEIRFAPDHLRVLLDEQDELGYVGEPNSRSDAIDSLFEELLRLRKA